MAGIGIDEVRHVAHLARLDLSENELQGLVGELSALLEHVDAIRGWDTEGVPATAHALPLSNVLRDDVVQPCLPRDEVLAAAPEADRGRFLVPSILREEP